MEPYSNYALSPTLGLHAPAPNPNPPSLTCRPKKPTFFGGGGFLCYVCQKILPETGSVLGPQENPSLDDLLCNFAVRVLKLFRPAALLESTPIRPFL